MEDQDQRGEAVRVEHGPVACFLGGLPLQQARFVHGKFVAGKLQDDEVMLAYEPIQITGHEVRTALSAERRVNILLSDLKRHAQFIAEIPEKYTCHIVPFSE